MTEKVSVCASSTRNDNSAAGKKTKVVVVLGAQFGDEGKGRIVDLFSQRADVVCRCQGGSNAAHMVVVGGRKYNFQLMPSGFVNPGCMNLIGNGVVVDLPQLFDEFKEHEGDGLAGCESRLIISSRAHLVFSFHRQADDLEESERGHEKLGTTRRGIGPTYSSKMIRNGIRVGDLVYNDFDVFTQKFHKLANACMKQFPGLKIDIDAELAWYKEKRDRVRPLVRDTVTYLHNVLNSSTGKTVIVEGAQAAMLDIDHGTYPKVTSSNCSIGGVITGLGIPPSAITDIYGVVKSYLTRHGTGCFPTEMEPELADHVRIRANDFAVPTGEPLRCGWIDIVMLRYAHMINGFSAFALIKLDILDDQPLIKIGVAYLVNGQKIDYFPICHEEFTNIEVEYCCMPGWNCSTEHVREFCDLPANAQAYVRKIEELTGVHVKWIGVGSERDAIITRSV